MKPLPSRLAQDGILVLLGVLCVFALGRVAATAGLHLPLDPNEGWNAYHTAALMHGGPLYPGPQAYLVNNYPPLSFYIVGAVGLICGDFIVAGRLVSLLAALAVGTGLFFSARAMGCGKRAAALPPLLFIAGLAIFSDYLGMDDPQMLAHAVAMAGLLVLLRGRRSNGVLAGAALLFVAAFFVKHNVLAMALAATLWLFLTERKNAFKLAGFGLAFLAAGLLLFRLVYGTSLISHLLTARLYSFEQLEIGLWGGLQRSGVALAGLGLLLLLKPRDRFVQLGALYAGMAILIGAVFLGGAGVDVNALFDANIALALAAALLLDRVRSWKGAVTAAYALPLLYFAGSNPDWQQADYWLRPLQQESALAKRDIAFLSAQKGPALCEMLSFCYWAQKPPAVDVFNIGQQIDTGRRDDAELVRWIEAKRFAAIQFDPDSPESLGENVRAAMDRFYRVDHSDGFGTFYVPR
jgi:hypothetical protein